MQIPNTCQTAEFSRKKIKLLDWVGRDVDYIIHDDYTGIGDGVDGDGMSEPYDSITSNENKNKTPVKVVDLTPMTDSSSSRVNKNYGTHPHQYEARREVAKNSSTRKKKQSSHQEMNLIHGNDDQYKNNDYDTTKAASSKGFMSSPNKNTKMIATSAPKDSARTTITTVTTTTQNENNDESDNTHQTKTKHKFIPSLPKIIHHQWKNSSVPSKYMKWYKQWKIHFPEPEYQHILWTDESMHDLIKNHYGWFLETYEKYDKPIKRADAARYFILHYMGGKFDFLCFCEVAVCLLLSFKLTIT